MTGAWWEFDVRRDDPRSYRFTEHADAPAHRGEHTLVRIDLFALTANNLTYAATGDELGYWRLFERPTPWGALPAWGAATVLASPSVEVGTQLYGFLPTATHAELELRPARGLVKETSERRSTLEPAYNAYLDVTGRPAEAIALRAALHPLFALGHALHDHLVEHRAFGAEQIVITSASSKAALCTAHLARGARPIIATTSAGNVDFVRSTGRYDQVIAYGERIPGDVPTVLIDIAGDERRLTAARSDLGAALVHVLRVGGTGAGGRVVVPDAANETMFFAPAQMKRMAQRLGPAEFARDLETRFTDFEPIARRLITLSTHAGRGGLVSAYETVLAGTARPDTVAIVRPNES